MVRAGIGSRMTAVFQPGRYEARPIVLKQLGRCKILYSGSKTKLLGVIIISGKKSSDHPRSNIRDTSQFLFISHSRWHLKRLDARHWIPATYRGHLERGDGIEATSEKFEK